MWKATLTHKELLELYIGGDSISFNRATEFISHENDQLENNQIEAFWIEKPLQSFSLPAIVVISDEQLHDILISIMASPHSPSPVTSLTRFLTKTESKDYIDKKRSALQNNSGSLCATLAIIESLIYSEGKISINQLSPATCKRTFSFAWGKVLSQNAPAKVLEETTNRWLEAYEIINPFGALSTIRHTISSSFQVFNTCARLELNLEPNSPESRLAHAIKFCDKQAQIDSWQELSYGFSALVPLSKIESITREERGKYLQEALRSIYQSNKPDRFLPMTAFLATKVAPGTLEHLDLLRLPGFPALQLWYGFFAALQSPQDILANQGGLGLRIRREIDHIENWCSHPTADIAFSELQAFRNIGVEELGKKLGHISECEVEIAPYINCSFSFNSRNIKAKQEASPQQLTLDVGETQRNLGRHSKENLLLALDELAQIVKELPAENGGTRKSRR